MKHFAACAMVVLFVALSTNGFSQNQTTTKAKNFSSYPDRISCKETDFASIFSFTPGQPVNLAFANGLTFKGTVSSNMVKYSNLQSVIIKSSTGDDEIFSISKITNEDRTVSYTGRILNQKYFDAYELRKDDTGNYQFTKVETDKVIQSCHQ